MALVDVLLTGAAGVTGRGARALEGVQLRDANSSVLARLLQLAFVNDHLAVVAFVAGRAVAAACDEARSVS